MQSAASDQDRWPHLLRRRQYYDRSSHTMSAASLVGSKDGRPLVYLQTRPPSKRGQYEQQMGRQQKSTEGVDRAESGEVERPILDCPRSMGHRPLRSR